MRVRQQCANVVAVDDGSTDEIAQVLAGLDVTVLRNKENCGKAGSLSRVFKHALAHGAIGAIKKSLVLVVCGESDRRFLDRLGCVAADPG